MLTDFHIHLARLPKPEALVRYLRARNIRWTAVACEPWEWAKLCVIWENLESENATEGCNLAFGIHPMIATQVGNEDFDGLERLLLKYPMAQAGEAGLDKRFPGYETGRIQEEVFLRQAKMAQELDRDLQIHCVGDYGRILDLLKDAGFGHRNNVEIRQKMSRPIFHRFGGDVGIAKRALEMGALFSLHKDSFRKKATAEAIKIIPPESLRFETDADESFLKLAGHENTSPEQWADYLEQILLGNQAKIV